MKVFFGERQTGRTTKLIEEWLKDSNGFLVVCNNHERERIFSNLIDRKDFNPQCKRSIITYSQFIDGSFLRGYADSRKPVVYIDNGFELMRQLIKADFCEFGAMTILGECAKCGTPADGGPRWKGFV